MSRSALRKGDLSQRWSVELRKFLAGLHVCSFKFRSAFSHGRLSEQLLSTCVTIVVLQRSWCSKCWDQLMTLSDFKWCFISLWWLWIYKIKCTLVICYTVVGFVLPSVLWHCWLGGRKGIRPVKNMGGWWRWALVSPDGVAPSQMVSVSVSVNLPLHHKVQKFSSGTGSPGGPGKRAVKWLWSCRFCS